MQDKVLEDSYSKIWFENQIIFCAFKFPEINLHIAEACVELRLKAVNGTAYPTFVDTGNIKGVTKEARDYFASKEAIQYIKAAALLAPSFVTKMMGTFFLTFNRPAVPIRLFTDRQEAIKWLEKYV
jgi:hypothetical protein